MSFTEKYESTKNVLCKVKRGIPEDERTLSLVRCNAELPHIKKYIDDLCSFFNVSSSVKNVLLLVLRKIDYDGCINLPTNYRALICESLNIKDSTLRNRLNLLVKKGFIINEGRNSYLINPHLFARGEWKKIVEQQAPFEIKIRYSYSGRTITFSKRTPIEPDNI